MYGIGRNRRSATALGVPTGYRLSAGCPEASKCTNGRKSIPAASTALWGAVRLRGRGGAELPTNGLAIRGTQRCGGAPRYRILQVFWQWDLSERLAKMAPYTPSDTPTNTLR